MKKKYFSLSVYLVVCFIGCEPQHSGPVKSKLINQEPILLDPQTLSVGGSFYSNGEPFDPKLIELLNKEIKPGDVLFDIGASTGSFTLLSKFRGIKVHAFEPNPFIKSILTKNVGLNEVDDRVTVHQMALGDANLKKDQNGKCTLKCPVSPDGELIETGLATLGSDPKRFSAHQDISVDCMTLDEFVEKHNITAINVMKIDTEGFEPNVLRGAKNSILKFRPIILMEYYEINLRQAGNTEQELKDLLENELAYDCHLVSDEDQLCRPR
jgi:FkbM family methyltransferase